MKKDERRNSERYDTEVSVYFKLAYDLKTKVEYQIIDTEKAEAVSDKHAAISRNVSAQGMCFTSTEKLEPGMMLNLEVFLPNDKTPIPMQGEVRWSHPSGTSNVQIQKYDTGIKILTVKAEPVEKSVYFDKEYKVEWSIVLEAILGKYRINSQKRK